MHNANATNFSSSSDRSQTQLEESEEEGEVTSWVIIKVLAYYAVILLILIGNMVVIKAIKKTGKTMRRKCTFFSF